MLEGVIGNQEDIKQEMKIIDCDFIDCTSCTESSDGKTIESQTITCRSS